MDEPLASLDADRKGEIVGLIERLRDEYRIPIVYVSHAVEEVSRLAGYVVVLEDGQVVATGAPAEALSEMNRVAHADRFGMVSIIECQVAGFDRDFEITTLHHPAGTITIAGSVGISGKAVRVLVHATDIALATSAPSNVSVRTVLSGTVAAIRSEAGPLCFVEIALDGGGRVTASVTRLAISELAVASGARIFALIKAVAIDERPFHSR